MKTIVVGKQKGGVGGSTLVRELAVAAAADGHQVVIIDLDAQHTVSKWWNRRTADGAPSPNPALSAPSPDAVADTLRRLADTVDVVIIDTPPSIHAYLSTVMRLADLILVPTRPTVDDIDALPALLEQIDGTGRPYAFVVTQSAAGRSRLFDDAVVLLARRGRVAPPLRMRTDFPAWATAGATAFEAGGKAADEVRALWEWTRDALDMAPVR